jgi:hypothetical protein
MEYLFMLGLGIFMGVTIHYIITVVNHDNPSGSFVIDLSDPMKDVCTLELDENLNDVYTKKQIILNVKKIEEISPK